MTLLTHNELRYVSMCLTLVNSPRELIQKLNTPHNLNAHEKDFIKQAIIYTTEYTSLNDNPSVTEVNNDLFVKLELNASNSGNT
jgi:hypothetical protein